VLHIVTVHFGSPLWIEIQTRYLREHLSVPYETWTSLEKIDPSHGAQFDHVVEQTGRHSDKLNHLAIEALSRADDDDLVMFLDGDAFPIADPMPLIAAALANAPLLAVKRPENGGDPQPHPCFCVTTAGAWRELGGDWSKGYTWINAYGRHVSDVGANLLRKLELTDTPWVPVLRSNRKDLDPVFFGVYGDTIYHHGAGFRGFTNLTRYHGERAPKPRELPRLPVVRGVLRRKDWQQREEWDRTTKQNLSDLSDAVIAKIQQGGSDWLAEFI
jgi:hypothetical protein